jgi:peptidoglycan/LPS O-acetylase OafA/YrhL
MLAARAWVRHGALAPGREANLRLGTALAALALLYWVLGHGGQVVGEATWLVVPAALGLTLHAAATCDAPAVRAILCNAPLRFAGRVSYSAYLYHLPLLVIWNTYPPPLPPWLNAPAYLAVSLVIAWVSWKYVEQPFLNPKPKVEPEPWPKSAAPGA